MKSSVIFAKFISVIYGTWSKNEQSCGRRILSACGRTLGVWGKVVRRMYFCVPARYNGWKQGYLGLLIVACGLLVDVYILSS